MAQQQVNQRDGTQLFRQENQTSSAKGKHNSNSENEIYSLKLKGKLLRIETYYIQTFHSISKKIY